MSLVVDHVFAKQIETPSLAPAAVVHFPKDQLLTSLLTSVWNSATLRYDHSLVEQTAKQI